MKIKFCASKGLIPKTWSRFGISLYAEDTSIEGPGIIPQLAVPISPMTAEEIEALKIYDGREVTGVWCLTGEPIDVNEQDWEIRCVPTLSTQRELTQENYQALVELVVNILANEETGKRSFGVAVAYNILDILDIDLTNLQRSISQRVRELRVAAGEDI